MRNVAVHLRGPVLGLLVAAVSCVSGDAPPRTEGPSEPDEGVETGSAPEPWDEMGSHARVQEPVGRMVSLVPSVTEVVAALEPKALLARTRYDRAPEMAHLPSIGTPLRPDLEVLARLRPDLVVVWRDLQDPRTVDRIEELGIPVHRAGMRTIGDLRDQVRSLGGLLGRDDRASLLLDSIDGGLRRISESVAHRPPVDVYYSVWHDPPRTTGPGTFVDEIIRYAGGRNVFRDVPVDWPTISLEELVRRDPEALVIVGSERTTTEPAWLRGPGWRNLSAVKAGRYLMVPDDLFNRPGPRVVEATLHLARFLHGEGVPGLGDGK